MTSPSPKTPANARSCNVVPSDVSPASEAPIEESGRRWKILFSRIDRIRDGHDLMAYAHPRVPQGIEQCFGDVARSVRVIRW